MIARTLAALAATLLLSSQAGAQEAGKASADAPVTTATPEAPATAPPPAADGASAPVPAPAPKPAGPGKPTLYGYVDVQYSRTDAPSPVQDSSTFELRRVRIGARGELTPTVGYAVLYDGAESALKDAYGTIQRLGFLPGVELRFGQWKTPFGYENPLSDTQMLWVNSSYVVQALARGSSVNGRNAADLYANPDARDIGAGFLGRWGQGGPLGAELAVSVVNGSGPNRKDDLDSKNVWGRAGLTSKTPLGTIKVGGSFGHGRQVTFLGANARFDGVGTPNDDTYLWFKTYGGDVQLDTPFLFAVAELIKSERDVTTYAAGVGTRSDFDARGWYAGAYGKTPWKLGPIFRAERFDRNRSVGANTNERYTLGAYVDVVPVNGRLIFNYELDESDRAVRTGDRAILFGQVVF
jgi:hypothetical protein